MKSKAVRAGDWLRFARQFMEKVPAHPDRQPGDQPGEDAALATQVLLAHALEKPRAWVLAHPETILTPRQQRLLTRLLGDLALGTPLPYLTGRQEFFGLTFEVSPAVLIPRPETELLVDRALEWLGRHPERRRAADVGTGSGCIAVSLSRGVSDLRILAVDRSWDALRIARRNAALHEVTDQITFLHGNLLSAAAGPFDLICANLPYIPSRTLSTLPVAEFEPQLALDGGPDGLDAIRALLVDAPRWLAPGGLLLLEMQYDQGEAVTALAQAHVPGAQIAVHSDLGGLPRLVEIIHYADHTAPLE